MRSVAEVTIDVQGPDLRGMPKRGAERYMCFCGKLHLMAHPDCEVCGYYPPGRKANSLWRRVKVRPRVPAASDVADRVFSSHERVPNGSVVWVNGAKFRVKTFYRTSREYLMSSGRFIPWHEVEAAWESQQDEVE